MPSKRNGGAACALELKIEMMQQPVLGLDWCKLGRRVKALSGEAQNISSFGPAAIWFRSFSVVGFCEN